MTALDSDPVRIGVFGGSFDPPHIAHFLCARVAAENLGLDRLLVVPAAVQPHKPEGAIAPEALRCEMIRAMIENDPLFELSTLELDRGGISFTVETLKILAVRYPSPQYELYLLIGADAINEFDAWRDPEEIFKIARVVVMERPGSDESADDSRWIRQLIHVNIPRLEISSSNIRERISAGLPVEMIVGSRVNEIIKRHGLYRLE